MKAGATRLMTRRPAFIRAARSSLNCLLPTPQIRDGGEEVAGAEGLGEVELEARGERAAAVFVARVGGERGRGRLAAALGRERAHAPDERVAVLARHPDVAHQNVRPPRLNLLKRLA